MSLFKDDSGKTEKPTPGRLSEAGNKGQVPLSREFTMAGTLLIAVFMLMSIGDWLVDALAGSLSRGLDVNLERHRIGDAGITDLMQEAGATLEGIGGPFVAVVGTVLLATMIAGYGQIGFKFRTSALRLRWESLNPVTNAAKLISVDSFVRTVVSAGKLLVLAGVLYFVLESRMPEFAGMYGHGDFSQSVDLIVDAAFDILLWIASIVFVIAAIDLAWQRYSYTKNLMMSRSEVDDERKRTDGDPLIKSRLRKAALEIMQQRMMEAVPKADVVITNPTHFAVAIRYQRGDNHAPQVVAKGVDDVAMRIREIADENDIPRMEDPPLARALFRAVKIGDEIPTDFYQAVATVLSQVYRLREEVA